ncbi:hypothetical protein EMIT0P74_10188 [Pseudomonas sp. IT-P74]|uniref:hypothetical protein n=1 Tax=Pseudomonas sp. IT-P74 TaxID=3026445 RepID=UPI0039E005D9
MKADVYMTKPRQKILLLTAGKEIASLPEKVQEFAKDMTPHGQWEIDPATPRIGLDQKAALYALQNTGFYTATAEINLEIVENPN